MKKELTKKFITENLEEAGCDCSTIACVIECCEEQDSNRMDKILAIHRRKLLDEVHKGYKCIDCLDYFSYQMKKNQNEEK